MVLGRQPDTFSMEFGFAHGSELVVEWKVSVLSRPLDEVPTSSARMTPLERGDRKVTGTLVPFSREDATESP